MTKKSKLLQKLLARPTSLKFGEIETILLDLGFKKLEAKGSHKKFKHAKLPNDLIIPVHNNDCKDFYKKLVSKLVKKYF